MQKRASWIDGGYLDKGGGAYGGITEIFKRRRLMITISTMLQFGLFLIALIGLVISLLN